MSQFLMPSLGADMESAVLMEWHVKEGDTVKKGQVIAEVETSKGVIEIEVFEDGVVEKLLVEPETECKVGTPLAMIISDNASDLQVQAPKQEEVRKEEEPVIVQKAPEQTLQQRVNISPAARKKAQELGVDLLLLSSKIKGTIQLSDVEEAAKNMLQTTSSTTLNNDGMRKAIAAAMSLSNATIPHYYLTVTINMTPSLKWLEALNAKRSIDERILPAALLIRASVKALKEVPELNGFYKDDTHQVSEEISPGIAIALRRGGLITPALLNAQSLDLNETMQRLGDLITRTRAGKLRGSEMTQQSITITNLGDLGVESVYGVIYPPQVALIGFGRITDAPWAEGDTLSVRKLLQATLAGDHRATDGRTGALFLDKLNQFLQKPEELL